MTTVPRTFWRWKGILESQGKKYVLIKDHEEIKMKEYYSYEAPLSVKEDYNHNKFREYARYPITLNNHGKIKVINLIYSPDSYTLEYVFDSENKIKNVSISDFNIYDDNY